MGAPFKVSYFFAVCISLFMGTASKGVAQQIPLDDLSAFDNPPSSWTISGDVHVNPLKAELFGTEEGRGILVGSASKDFEGSYITTEETHGDTVLDFEVLLSHGASVEVYLQGRYGVQFANSWGKDKLTASDNGSIIPVKSFDAPSVEVTPRMNVAAAPGVWQRVRIVFDAPMFDSQGQKTKDARFTRIEQNGVIIHGRKDFSGPSRNALFLDESEQGPFVLRVSNGPVAFRNVRYTKDKEVQIRNLSYELYEDKFLTEEFIWEGDDDRVALPGLNSEDVSRTGDSDLLNSDMADEVGSDFAVVFEGDLLVPTSGEYHFQAIPSGYGAFSIEGQELLRWDALHDKGETDGFIELEEGIYSFRFVYFNFRQPEIGLFVEGGVRRQALHEQGIISIDTSTKPILLTPTREPLIQRSFVNHRNGKLLSCINVGDASGVHYTMNLATGGLVQIWKGEFGDVTSMREGRGLHQVLEPLGSVLVLSAEQQAFLSVGDSTHSSNSSRHGDYRGGGYDLNEAGFPIFHYSIDDVMIEDKIVPGDKEATLTRSLKFNTPSTTEQTIIYAVAVAPEIERISETVYSVGDKMYYVEIDAEVTPLIQNEGEQQLLLVPVELESSPQAFDYSIIW